MSEAVCIKCNKYKQIRAKGMCSSCYNKPYIKKYMKKFFQTHPEILEKQIEDCNKTVLCKILKTHHESTKHDPEHLSTDFIKQQIKKLSGKDVDCGDEKI